MDNIQKSAENRKRVVPEEFDREDSSTDSERQKLLDAYDTSSDSNEMDLKSKKPKPDMVDYSDEFHEGSLHEELEKLTLERKQLDIQHEEMERRHRLERRKFKRKSDDIDSQIASKRLQLANKERSKAREMSSTEMVANEFDTDVVVDVAKVAEVVDVNVDVKALKDVKIAQVVDVNVDHVSPFVPTFRLAHYFDAESIVAVSLTCTRLENVAKNLFRHKKTYTCYIGSPEDIVIAVRTLRKIGTHLRKIDLKVDLPHGGCSLTKFFRLLAESVGPNLTELIILGEICLMQLEILEPILCQLEVLMLHNLCWKEDCASMIDLPSLCPNLRELLVFGKIIFAPKPEKLFRRLKTLDVTFTSLHISESVFMQNQQLTKLNLRNCRTTNSIDLNSFDRILINLVKLHLDVGLIKNPIEDLPALSNFQCLNSLELYSIPAALFNDIIKILETLVRLREIVLQCHLTRLDTQFLSIQESLAGMASKLTQLQSFETVSIDWTAESVENFVRRAKMLTCLDFWSGDESNYTITPEFIRSLAKIRKSMFGIRQPLYLKFRTRDEDLKQVFNEPDVASVIKLIKHISI
ncbi:hypothetical protein HA402_015994 [Bradysia odoriphaga]|nr:hypothetical protein HA402_015994 [Bradysia odoriphaga]